ncbi:amidase [Muricoccus vinaceus]|uniref:Amidase n=1 Tax=Muricoccus vinaceus TaxID=424704 RepID=A0ABV6IQD5_9PROT
MAAFSEYGSFDAVGLAQLIERRKVSASEVAEAAAERIARLNPALNALTASFPEHGAALAAQSPVEGHLCGVPFLLKDLSTHLAGTRLTNGSALYAGYVSTESSTIVERYLRAGLVIVGKTNTPEFGLSPATEPLFTGATRNPWDLERSAAGSSGGSAVAVASGMVPAAHATDGGGSIRAPASACGLVGLKPTRARTPSGPFAGEGWGGYSVAHVLSRSVRDSAALLDATHGLAPGDPYAAPTPAGPFLCEVGADPGRLRMAFTTRFAGGPETEPDCMAATEQAAALCASLGHHVEVDQPDFSMDEFACSNLVIATHIRLAILQRAMALGRDAERGDVEPLTWAAAETARGTTAAEYAGAINALHGVSRRIARFFDRYDVLITPTLAQVPPPLGTLRKQDDSYAEHRRKVRDFAPFTGIFNVTGQPAISLPLGMSREGLPVGVQFVGGFGREDVLLRLSAQLEQAQPWCGRRPPCAT